MTSDSPYKPPSSELIDAKYGEITRRGRYVVLQPDTGWPSRCFKCNKETDHKREVRLTYVNPWILITILINILITIVLALIFRKRFKILLPLCEEHARKRKNFLIFQWGLVALLILSIAVGVASDWIFLVYVSIFIFALIVLSAIFGRLAYAAKFKDGNIWVRGAGREFLDSLPEHAA